MCHRYGPQESLCTQGAQQAVPVRWQRFLPACVLPRAVFRKKQHSDAGKQGICKDWIQIKLIWTFDVSPIRHARVTVHTRSSWPAIGGFLMHVWPGRKRIVEFEFRLTVTVINLDEFATHFKKYYLKTPTDSHILHPKTPGEVVQRAEPIGWPQRPGRSHRVSRSVKFTVQPANMGGLRWVQHI